MISSDWRRVILSIGLFAVVLSPASVEAQVFGKGARTEFLTGFGFRTFVSVLEMTDPSADGQTGSPVFRRRVTPLNIVYGARPGLSLIAVLPFVDTALTAPSSAAASEIGGDGGLGRRGLSGEMAILQAGSGQGDVPACGRRRREGPDGRERPPRPCGPATAAAAPARLRLVGPDDGLQQHLRTLRCRRSLGVRW